MIQTEPAQVEAVTSALETRVESETPAFSREAAAAPEPSGVPPEGAEVVRETPPEPPLPARPILEFDWQSDLTQIETDRSKWQAAQARAEFDEPAPPSRKRERRAPPPVSDEPLVQVETNAARQEAIASQKPASEASNALTH